MSVFFDKSDSVLWLQASNGDTAAEEALVIRYTRLVRACARPYFLAGGDREDLIQEGMLGLLSAIRRFDPNKSVKFNTFAEYCIRRRIFDAIKASTRDKSIPLNTYVSLESPWFDEIYSPAASNLRDPEELVIANERAEELKSVLKDSLSSFEKTILDLYLDGMSYAEMAQRVGKPTKSVDNAVQRIKKKLGKQLTKGGNSEN